MRLVDRVLRLPVSFFDINPSGRIINRFSRDTDIMDSVLPLSLSQIGVCASQYIGILIVISLATPWFLLMLPPVTLVYFILQRYYIPGARELQRLETVTRSPIYSGFSEAVNGLATIRAFRRQAHFTGLEDRLISENGLVYLTQRAGAGWLSIRLDFLGLLVLTAAGVLAVAGGINPQLAGLSLSYALELTKCALYCLLGCYEGCGGWGDRALETKTWCCHHQRTFNCV
jgi:ATP-binding cassette, subfamily C (CFTR/MRP), member 1